MNVYVLVPRTETGLAQQALDAYVTGSGPRSIQRIIYGHPGLGLSDGTDAHTEGIRAYGGKSSTAGIDHVGAVVRLTVRTSGA
ncbi:hypothetical protein [Streptomyces sp. NPDC007100]|uniref:hypothetical protein n=1 Tax=Streptomyces sp. NPDC007100 TaxID=3155602 RepID=UPI0033E17968